MGTHGHEFNGHTNGSQNNGYEYDPDDDFDNFELYANTGEPGPEQLSEYASTTSNTIDNSSYNPHIHHYPPNILDEIRGHERISIPFPHQTDYKLNGKNPGPNAGVYSNSNTNSETDIDGNFLVRNLLFFRSEVSKYILEHRPRLKLIFYFLLLVLYNIYIIFAIVHHVHHEISLNWCNGFGFLIILTGIVYWSLFYYLVLKKLAGPSIKSNFLVPITQHLENSFSQWYLKPFIGFLLLIGVLIFLIIDSWDQPRRLVSAFGVFILLLVGFLISKHPARIKWSQISWALGIQFTFGLLILRWDPGRNALDCLSLKVKNFLDFASFGSDFVYGYLSSGQPADGTSFQPIFAFRALTVVFFFGFFISLLYHYGAMQWFISKLGWIMQITIGTTAAESCSAAANIFVGLTEAPLLIKPFLGRMTNSEIHAVMTGGFATIAGSVMAAYIGFGISASYLLSACVMAAFSALGYSKLIYPETRVSHTTSDDITLIETKSEGNAIDAAAQGAIQGVVLVGSIVANLIAFVSFVAFLNGVIWYFGSLVGFTDLSFELILGKIFIPVAWIIGIDTEECEDVARLLGLKTVANEFIAYQRLAKMSLSPRSRAISTYALCSFANIGSVGIQLGGLSALVPERRVDFGRIVGRAFVTGTLVGFLNACIAGSLLSEPGYSAWRAMDNSINKIINQTIA